MYALERLYPELLKRNIVYRFNPDRLISLRQRKLGFGFDPPSKETMVGADRVIDEVIPTSFEPVVITAEQWAECQELCAAWDRFFRFIYMNFETAMQAGDLNGHVQGIANPAEREHFRLDPGYRSLMPFVRFDCAIREDGTFAVMDVNSSRPIGAGHMLALTKLMTESQLTNARPIASIDPLVRTIMTCYREWCASRGIQPNESPDLAIAIPSLLGSEPDFRVLAKQLSKTKQFASVTLVDPEDLKVIDSQLFGIVNGSSVPLELVLRTVKPDLHPGIAPALLEAYPTAACIIGPMWRRWIGSKLWMALAQVEPMRSDVVSMLGTLAPAFFRSLPRTGLYTGGRARFSDGYIPLERLRPSEWVAKVPSGSSARGVYVGRSMSASDWIAAVAGLSDSTVIIQEFVEPKREALTIPDGNGGAQRGNFLTKHGLFSFGGEAAGIEVHACLDSYKIHGGRGTLAVPAFVRS